MLLANVNEKKARELPIKAFISKQVINNQQLVERVFVNIPSTVSAYEAEEVGVEHLLREVKDLNFQSLKTQMKEKVNALALMKEKIQILEQYLDDCINDRVNTD